MPIDGATPPGADVPACPRESITTAFGRAAARDPGRTAVSSRDWSFTYRELDAASRALASAIRRDTTEAESVVLLAGRNALAPLGLLASVRAGRTCVPVYPDNHEDRLLPAILAQHPRALLLSDHPDRDAARPGIETARLRSLRAPDTTTDEDEAPGATRHPEAPAFVIHTSGSTGRPKGVIHGEGSIVSRIRWWESTFGLEAADCSLLLSTADAISGIIGMLRPILTGGRAHLFDLREEGFPDLLARIADLPVTILPLVNSVYRYLLAALPAQGTGLASLRLVILGGEAMTAGDVEGFRRHFPASALLVNTLGATEVPTYCHLAIDRDRPVDTAGIPAGRPVEGHHVELLDEDDRPVIDGEVGEICVTGADVAFGYWRADGETGSRFEDRGGGRRRFRTGDLGRVDREGLLHHEGRKDNQVKILGNRVDLTEIEDLLRRQPGIADAAVVPAIPGSGPLHAHCVVASDNGIDEPALRRHLAARLPDYLVPARIILHPSLPLTRTGKIDRSRLAGRSRPAAEAPTRAEPGSTVEARVLACCAAALGQPDLRAGDCLLERGCNSLLMSAIVSRLEEWFSRRIPLSLAFEDPSPRGLARSIEAPPRHHRTRRHLNGAALTPGCAASPPENGAG